VRKTRCESGGGVPGWGTGLVCPYLRLFFASLVLPFFALLSSVLAYSPPLLSFVLRMSRTHGTSRDRPAGVGV